MDTFEIVTDRIIAELEQGVVPWKKPWSGTAGAISHITGKRYSLLNQLLLGEPGEYVTFRQALEEGGHVKKGEKAKYVVFWKWLEVKDEDTGEVKQVPFLRYYTVFHVNQCEGIDPKFIASQPRHTDLKPDETAEKVLSGYVARSHVTFTSTESDQAFYRPLTDEIVVPLISQFDDIAEYYSTAFHESVHSTGHQSRLNRIDAVSHFGSEEYSREELVAELGSSYLVNYVGLESKGSFQNSASYIDGWLKVLKSDKRFIVAAAGKAEKAVRYILGEENEECRENT